MMVLNGDQPLAINSSHMPQYIGIYYSLHTTLYSPLKCSTNFIIEGEKRVKIQSYLPRSYRSNVGRPTNEFTQKPIHEDTTLAPSMRNVTISHGFNHSRYNLQTNNHKASSRDSEHVQ